MQGINFYDDYIHNIINILKIMKHGHTCQATFVTKQVSQVRNAN